VKRVKKKLDRSADQKGLWKAHIALTGAYDKPGAPSTKHASKQIHLFYHPIVMEVQEPDNGIKIVWHDI
jgi:hypothetical protein